MAQQPMKKQSKDERKKENALLVAIGAVFVTWFGILVAPYTKYGLFGMLDYLEDAITHPFRVSFCDKTGITVLILLFVYALVMLLILSDQKNYRRGEEHGSAEWGNVNSIAKRYKQAPESSNKILTQHFEIGLDGHKHRRNLNTLIVGGSGAGKTRFYAKPNIMQCNTSYVILDPKGEIIRDTGTLLEQQGYKIKVLDLINMEKSNGYNPFVYLETDNDVQRLVTNLFKATTPKEKSGGGDPFWDTAAEMLLMAIMFLLYYECDEDDQNFSTVMYLLRCGKMENEDDTDSPLDRMFEDLRAEKPDHIALKYYDAYHSGAGKTLQSIQITLASRLEKFNLAELAKLTQKDELDIASMGEEKTALFCIIPDNDSSFNFIISMLYTQLFQQLFNSADYVHKYDNGGALPVPVHFVMDEFANVSLPDDFDKILAVMRSRNVFVSIIIQNLAQLKTLFDKQWESIVGNCDEFLYLGGNEKETHKYVSELLGKETIDTTTNGKTHGEKGNYSTNYQNAGRELMTPDEVRMLDNKYCILFVRGERPIMDQKYEILNHPNVKWTTDGDVKPYDHGVVRDSVATITYSDELFDADDAYTVEEESNEVLVSGEDLAADYEEQIQQYREQHKH